MNNQKMLFCIVILVLFVFVNFAVLHAQNFFSNGDFEDGFTGWNSKGQVLIADSFAYSGSHSLQISTTTEQYAYIYLNFPFRFSSFEGSFWIYPDNDLYDQAFELVANWDLATADFIFRLHFKNDSIEIFSLGVDTTIQNLLELHYWNKISFATDSAALKKVLTINDNSVHSIVSSYSLPVETLIMGDLSRRANYGTVFYDLIEINGKIATGIKQKAAYCRPPENVNLFGSYPNPFNQSTNIYFASLKNNYTTLKIFNSLGKEIEMVYRDYCSIGEYQFLWRPLDLSSGIYFVQLQSDESTLTKAIIFQK